MDEQGFVTFMKKKGKTPNTIESCIENAREFVAYLEQHGKSIDRVSVDDLEAFATEYLDKKTASKYMWSLGYFFLFLENKELLRALESIRRQQIKVKKQPFKLKDFRGVKPEHASALASAQVKDVVTMLKAGRTPNSRAELAKKTKLDIKVIEELVKLSDIARIPGLKGIRARLYYDAGFDQLRKLRGVTPEELLRITREFVEKTGFDGIAPLPKEAKSTIETAKKLSDLVEW
jgi:hypothetical protein